MSPGQTEFEGWVAWITYHLLLGEQGYDIQPLFAQRFPGLPAWAWRDAFTAALRGVTAAGAAFGGAQTDSVGSFLGIGPGNNQLVSIRMRIHFRFPDGTEKWMIADMVESSDQVMAQVYTDAIAAAQQLASRSGSRLVEFDLMPPFYPVP